MYPIITDRTPAKTDYDRPREHRSPFFKERDISSKDFWAQIVDDYKTRNSSPLTHSSPEHSSTQAASLTTSPRLSAGVPALIRKKVRVVTLPRGVGMRPSQMFYSRHLIHSCYTLLCKGRKSQPRPHPLILQRDYKIIKG